MPWSTLPPVRDYEFGYCSFFEHSSSKTSAKFFFLLLLLGLSQRALFAWHKQVYLSSSTDRTVVVVCGSPETLCRTACRPCPYPRSRTFDRCRRLLPAPEGYASSAGNHPAVSIWLWNFLSVFQLGGWGLEALPQVSKSSRSRRLESSVKSRKIRLIESNAKCRYLKKLTCKGTLWQVFYLSESPCPPMTPYSRPLHTVYVYTVYLFTQGRGGGKLTNSSQNRSKILIWLTVSPFYKLYWTLRRITVTSSSN